MAANLAQLNVLHVDYIICSSPLAGLVLVDPLLLPMDGRRKKGIKETTMDPEEEEEEEEGIMATTRWKESLSDLIAMLENNKSPQMYNDAAQSSPADGHIDPPLLLPNGTDMQPSDKSKHDQSTLDAEISLLRSLLANDNSNKNDTRSLKLESGSIPVLVLYSGDHAYHDYYRICSERTAAFHTCDGGDYFDQVSVLKIPKKDGGSVDDLDWITSTIYEWYDDVVS